ncbi:MAG: flagellar hook assembly protein FlgD [Hyphomicrobiaceae bacterium]|jgi:flagellar basal-body rod modification protein FlgD
MQVPSTTSSTTQSSTTTSTAATDASKNMLDYNTFLQLLIAEMKNQDPTKPMDSAQYIGQLASFSNVEQAVKTNAKLDAMMSSLALTQAEGFIGRTVTAADDSVSGKVTSVRVTADGALATLDNGSELLLAPGIKVA